MNRVPRSLRSIGLASVLQESAEIYYVHLSSVKTLGRLQDVAGALLQEKGVDPWLLRLVQILQVGLVIDRLTSTKENPILVEFGCDGTHWGVAFSVGLGPTIAATGWEARIEKYEKEELTALQGVPTQWEFLLHRLRGYCSEIWIKKVASTQTVEIACVLTREDVELRGRWSKIQFVEIDTPEPTPVVKKYTEIGEMIRANESNVRKAPESDPDEKRIVTGGGAEEELRRRVTGGRAPEEEIRKVKGKKGLFDKLRQWVKGEKEEDQGDENRLIQGSAPETVVETKTEIVKEFIIVNQGPSKEDEKLASDTNDLVDSLERGKFEKMIRELEERLLRAEEDSTQGDKKAAWAKRMVNEVISEKSRLKELAQSIQHSLRQKDHEIRTRNALYQAEIRGRDEQLKQRELALQHVKDQLANLQVLTNQLKEEKANKVNSSGDSMMLRHKITKLEQENVELEKMIKELKGKKTSSGAEGSAGEGNQDLVAELNDRNEKLMRQAEEFKKANQVLLERVNDLSRNGGGGNKKSELQSKLEGSMKVVAGLKKDLEKSQNRYDTTRQEVTRLQNENAKLQEELKRLRNQNAA